jgi:hypothetical protein
VDKTGSFILASGEGQSVFTTGEGAYGRFTVVGLAKNFRGVAVYTTDDHYHMAIDAQ